MSGFYTGVVSFILVLVFFIKPATADIVSKDNLSIYADFRARLEADWDSTRANGLMRSDRTRARIRGRIGIKFNPTDKITLNIRLRTGSNRSQQSPHITVADFDSNPKGKFNVNLDKWYVEFKDKKFSLWGGRNSPGFWKQNEILWDDDVTVLGGGATFTTQAGSNGTLLIQGGYYRLPVGQQNFSGNMAAVQVVFKLDGAKADLVFAGGVLAIDGSLGDADAGLLLNGNGLRNYLVLVGSIQAKFPIAGKMPVTLGLDIYHNTKTYLAGDAFGFANNGQKDGFVLSAKYGQLSGKGNWLVGYYFARIEALAVNSSYAQDDWVRWGSAFETRATNLSGHEFRIAYAFAKNFNVIARLYITKAITSVEDGKRFRLDFNYKF